jgi:DnaJ family protein B protein 4
MTHYEILGIDSDASEQEIRKAYRALSLKYHPDKNSDEDATKRFHEISTAYDILSDPEKRSQYDFELKGSFPGFPGFPGHGFQGFPGQGFGSMDDIFQMMFEGKDANVQFFHGNGPVFIKRQNTVQKPQPLITELVITLEQAFNGVEVTVDFERIVVSGVKTLEKDQIKFSIPVGIQEGETIMVPEKGHITNPFIKGDLHIRVKYATHPIFTRRGNDLICLKHISLKESLCGFLLELDHINGKKLRHNHSNSQVIKPGDQKIINSYGMVSRSGVTGNLVIEFMIDFPESLTEEQKVKLSEIF